jgi:hypothetical protein
MCHKDLSSEAWLAAQLEKKTPMTDNKIEQLETGRRYLVRSNVKYGYTNKLYEINILEVSESAYKIRYDGADKATWQRKEDFENEYTVLEKLPYT